MAKKLLLIFSIVSLLFLSLLIYQFYKRYIPHKLDEATFYKDDFLELKVVRYLENMPFHYYGNVARVMARSSNTAHCYKRKYQDSGWRELGTPFGDDPLGPNPSLELLVEAARNTLKVTDQGTMIYGKNGVVVTWDGCGTMRYWGANNIKGSDFVSTDKYEKCLEESLIKEKNGALSKGWGKLNCWSRNFHGENSFHTWDLYAKKDGYASFKVKSNAFKDSIILLVETHDFGKTWKETILPNKVITSSPVPHHLSVGLF